MPSDPIRLAPKGLMAQCPLSSSCPTMRRRGCHSCCWGTVRTSARTTRPCSCCVEARVGAGCGSDHGCARTRRAPFSAPHRRSVGSRCQSAHGRSGRARAGSCRMAASSSPRRVGPCLPRAGPSVTRASRWARSSGSRSSATCRTSRGAVGGRRVRRRGASHSNAGERDDRERDRQARRTRGAHGQHDRRRVVPDRTAIEVLEAIPGPCSMHVYVGGHRDLPPTSMPGMIRFLRRARSQTSCGVVGAG